MANITTTWVQSRPPVAAARLACLVHIYPSGPKLGYRYCVGDAPIVIGRTETCDIAIPDHSVSRMHARVETTPTGVSVTDLKSTNGTFINDRPVTSSSLLRDGDYLRAGNCIYRFLAGGNVEADYHEEIYRLTIVDALTQAHNRRYMLDFLEREQTRSARHARPLALLLFDLDHFKSVNDRLGHLAGDYALRELSARIRGTVRREDLFARYGGEEFAVVLVETPPAAAAAFAERLRACVADRPFRFEKEEFNLTVSVGVVCTAGDTSMTGTDLIQLADRRLAAAKRAGRNRIVGPDDVTPAELSITVPELVRCAV
ncbi:MAG: diguanylate cyclase [Gemmataceae bacterium]